MAADLTLSFQDRLKGALRPLARKVGLAAPAGAWDAIGNKPWALAKSWRKDQIHSCNICGWAGNSFNGPFHCEMAECPRCGSIARDRFLLFCFLSRTPDAEGMKVLETSPRLGAPYRRMMRKYFDYTSSDYDLSAHEGDIRLDLQKIDLPSQSVDILLTPHVLEHVPETTAALSEIHRILSPGGKMYLQVPLCRGLTRTPDVPEFHADNTKVFYNFGWDLTNTIRSCGFEVRVLITEAFHRILSDQPAALTLDDPQFDIESIRRHATLSDLDIVSDTSWSDRMGFLPAYQFVTWECTKISVT